MPDEAVKDRKVNRRGFLKSAGAIAGSAGALAVSGKAMAFQPVKESLPSWIVRSTVNYVDTFPYELGGVKRYARRQSPQGDPEGLKEYLAGTNRKQVLAEKMEAGEPGFTAVDKALHDAARTSKKATDFYSWEPLAAKPLTHWKGTPAEANLIVKKAARILGAGDVGIAATDPLWFFSSSGTRAASEIPIIFTDDVDKPSQEADAVYIPNSMTSVVVMVVPQDLQLLQFTPSALGEAAVMYGYSRMAETASKLAEFIRSLGYQAVPMGNEFALSVPMAIDAGLGELGRNGLLIHPVYGPNVRICKVLTDMPIEPDRRISFGVHEFCKACKKCARECPSQGIPYDEDFNAPVCPSNNPGPKKWYVDTWSCYKFWNENGGSCSTCMRVCPYTKPQTWPHDMVKGITATTGVLNSAFVAMDDLMGYGSTYNEDDAGRFWTTPEWWSKS